MDWLLVATWINAHPEGTTAIVAAVAASIMGIVRRYWKPADDELTKIAQALTVAGMAMLGRWATATIAGSVDLTDVVTTGLLTWLTAMGWYSAAKRAVGAVAPPQ